MNSSEGTLDMNTHPRRIPAHSARFALAASCLTLGVLDGCSSPQPGSFDEPEHAVLELGELIGTGDEARAEALFGAGSLEILRSGDDVADQENGERVKALIHEKVAIDYVDERTAVALLGEEEWPFAIPLVLDGGHWRFDVEAGREELLNRRVGANELLAIAALRALVDAQREYIHEGRDGNPPAYAMKLTSDPGKQNGLYWPVGDGEAPSPMGELVARAATEGYAAPDEDCEPFHGYYFRLLTEQGENAPGGARDYVDENGLLTGGFAGIAWPAKYGNSGIMTFMISDRGMLFEKDLGPQTDRVVAEIKAYDPDETWYPTGDE
jgi:hypothetical protein